MLKLILYYILLLLTCNILYGQVTFSRLISSPADDRVLDCAEDQSGRYILIGKVASNSEPLYKKAKIWILDQEGLLTQELEFDLSDSVSYFGDVYCKDDTIIIFGAKGPLSTFLCDQIWFLNLTVDLQINFTKSHGISGYNIVDFSTIVNHEGHFILCGMGNSIDPDPDIYFYKLTEIGDSIKFVPLILQQPQIEYDFIESITNDGYKVFSTGIFPGSPSTSGVIVHFDQEFNYLYSDSIPMRIYHLNSAKYISDSNYLLTGKVMIYETFNHQHLGIVKLNSLDELLNYNHYGMGGDTTSNPAALDNLDYISVDNIYFGGTSNFIAEHWPWQSEDSWLILNNIDSNLNLNWQKYYGGDAFYYMWGLLATQDGGCLMYATKYDEQTQYHENDVMIIKVDSNGLLTSALEFPAFDPGTMAIYPNPASDQAVFTIFPPAISQYISASLCVLDIHGREYFRKKFFLHAQPIKFPLDVSDYPAGLYLVTLDTGAGQITAKLAVISVR